jgi:RNA polymerase sigma factor (sigma-70 family)
MATKAGDRILRAALSAAAVVPLTDGELLARFNAGEDGAFAALVQRHTSLVLGVCRRLLPTVQDAEDACQATFLVLSRKARSGRWQSSIANWLFTTARRIALKASRTAARRQKREARLQPPPRVSALDQMTGREAFVALDEELDKLPALYREPLVLCYLQGLTRDEAAVRLGVPAATLKSQLERGRKKLADALTRRGIVPGAGLLALAATSAARASAPQLVESILATVRGAPSSPVAALAQGVAVNGLLSKARLILLAIVVIALTGVGIASMRSTAEPQQPTFDKTDPPPAKADRNSKEEPDPDGEERTITGKVLGADGKPREATLALLWIEGQPQPLGRTKADGTFRVTVPRKRKDQGGWLVARAAGHGMDFQPHGQDSIPQSTTPTAEVTMNLPKELPIRGRILDPQGKPVAGASVVAVRFSAYNTDESAYSHLLWWTKQRYPRGGPPDGDRMLWFDRHGDNPEGRSPYTTRTDRDGRFVLAGVGADQVVTLGIHCPGMADLDVALMNQTGFDPNPFNKSSRETEMKEPTLNTQWKLHAPDPVVVVELEKIIRGTVTDPEGRPCAAVPVVFWHSAVRGPFQGYTRTSTDKDGNYTIHGARKQKSYFVECPPDPRTGLLSCQISAEDTAGYTPITVDLKCARGILVTGTVRNKVTGKPVVALFHKDVLANNPFITKDPAFRNVGLSTFEHLQTDKEGRYRLVIPPGPVLLMAESIKGDRREFWPSRVDPAYPDYFTDKLGSLNYYGTNNSIGMVQGHWCKVIDARPTDTELTLNVELVPSSKQSVKVVDGDGQPVTDAQATGITHENFRHPMPFPKTDTLTVLNVDPKEGRFLAVVHPGRKLVGTLALTVDAANPTVKLGPGSTVTGRAVDEKGKPLAGLVVYLAFDQREVGKAYEVFVKGGAQKTDADGAFRYAQVFPGQKFRVVFSRDGKQFVPNPETAPRYLVAEHNDTLKLGDLKVEFDLDKEEK